MNRSTPFSLKKPQVLKGGPRHPVLIAVQPTEPAEQHTAPQPLPLRGQQQQRARAAETARAMPPSFPPGVVNSSSSCEATVDRSEPVLDAFEGFHYSGRVRDGLPLGPPGDPSPTKGTAVELRGALNFRGLRVTRALGRLSVRGC